MKRLVQATSTMPSATDAPRRSAHPNATFPQPDERRGGRRLRRWRSSACHASAAVPSQGLTLPLLSKSGIIAAHSPHCNYASIERSVLSPHCNRQNFNPSEFSTSNLLWRSCVLLRINLNMKQSKQHFVIIEMYRAPSHRGELGSACIACKRRSTP